jgi:hypothetical protein
MTSKHDLLWAYRQEIVTLLHQQAILNQHKLRDLEIHLGELAQQSLLLMRDDEYRSNQEWISNDIHWRQQQFLVDIQHGISGHAWRMYHNALDNLYSEMVDFVDYVKHSS